uniref:Dlg1_5 protein n=1 Tax=Fopius arisanus TaxID=64838 RepID=A0A0C9RJM8_9HYME
MPVRKQGGECEVLIDDGPTLAKVMSYSSPVTRRNFNSEAHRALELLEDYRAKLTRPQDKQLRLAIERVIRIFKSRLFQALLDIQEFYELTLLDESKSVQQKTAETIRIADKWEASDGPITPTFAQNDKIYYPRDATRGVDDHLPPPPSPPLLKETVQLDGVSRPNSVERVLHSDGSQHVQEKHDMVNKSHDSWQGHDGDQDFMEYEDTGTSSNRH